MTTHIYTDGACEPNPGWGGWAMVVYEHGQEITNRNGGASDTTNNFMEMTAVLVALEHAARAGLDPSTTIVHSDSQYVVKGMNKWRHAWERQGWKRKQEAPLKNAGLWQAMAAVHDAFPCRIQWVRGHSGVPGNERADRLAAKGRAYALGRGHEFGFPVLEAAE